MFLYGVFPIFFFFLFIAHRRSFGGHTTLAEYTPVIVNRQQHRYTLMLMSEVVLITGGAHRLGKAITKALVAEGYQVIVHYNTSKAEARILEASLSVKTIQGDLTHIDQLSTLFDHATTLYGHIDHLINNASAFEVGTIDTLTYQSYQAMMDIHATAPLFLSQALYRHHQGRSTTGSIINIVDTKVSSPTASRVAYYLSKGALLEQTNVLAVALGPTLRVNAISPGAILSNGDDAYFEKMANTLPLKKSGSPEAIAEAVLYLLKADFVSGIELPVDAGQKLL